MHLEEIEVFLWPKLTEEYFFGGVGIRNASKERVDARGNSWIPESPAPDRQVQSAVPAEVLTGQAAEPLPALPEFKLPDLPRPNSTWRLPEGMPHGRDKIVLDDWGPLVPKGWVQ